ncbi:MAG: D-alanine--D-alanine ligase [Bacteroidetes bacterium]|nr:D-alanine--D-alanine ligase [Bacteroidota bacterium]
MIRVGIFFGGISREREVSFAGGRTVYDNLDKNLFEAIPVFVDPWGNFAVLDWAFVYRGTIRDFYPPVSYLPESKNQFQIYADSLQLTKFEQREMLSQIGRVINPNELSELIDFAFLALHGLHGEDGTIQGLLEWMGIPYSGSSILPSAFGMNKAVQKKWLASQFEGPEFISVLRNAFFQNPKEVAKEVLTNIGFPLVVKSANQGSSIGVGILKNGDEDSLLKAIENAFFTIKPDPEIIRNNAVEFVRNLSDIRSSIGFPLILNGNKIYHPEDALDQIQNLLQTNSAIEISAVNAETEVVIEQFIEGREFSCIVIRDIDGSPKALPPTEIVKRSELFDYRSKYLPGLSRKVTPIDLPDADVERIREECVRLYEHCGFEVYARIDGFFNRDGKIFLNDPNTTSGMMPSSFFFHQASEIGLNPSQFLTYIFRTSLEERRKISILKETAERLSQQFDKDWQKTKQASERRTRVAIIMGGYSTERHISVESGRNIYEKLASSARYEVIPIFLTGSAENHLLFRLPVNIMLKDNADDIGNKLKSFHQAEVLKKIIQEFSELTNYYTLHKPIFEPVQVTYEDLPEICDEVFIALHGRPGEDGAVQKHLDQLGIPYNGSGVQSSEVTIDKFTTNNILRENGFLVADNYLVLEDEWKNRQAEVERRILEIGFPLIAKPSDEGCSSAVLKLKNMEEVRHYAQLTFRNSEELTDEMRQLMQLDQQDEFPKKPYFLIENCIEKGDAHHFLEITGGMLTFYKNGVLNYEVFEPSEALASGAILSLAEKFLAGEGQNITPARFSKDPDVNRSVSAKVREVLEGVARTLKVEGYCRIDAFVKIYKDGKIEVYIIEINSLPGMTPATCIYHQAAINGYKPFDFIDKILTFGRDRLAAGKHLYENS